MRGPLGGSLLAFVCLYEDVPYYIFLQSWLQLNVLQLLHVVWNTLCAQSALMGIVFLKIDLSALLVLLAVHSRAH